MTTLADKFWRFSGNVIIPSKDQGPVPFRPFGTQRYLITEILQALSEDVRHVIVLKPRQVGATTVLAAFDAYWLLAHKGLQGTFIANNDENLSYFRDVLSEIVKGLPPAYSYPVRLANRVQLAWSNGSRLLYQAAGVKSRGKLGRGRGLNFLHGTEVAYWGDPEGIQGLRAALSESHPAACYLWESTANGFNHFYDMWQEAQHAVTMRAIFVPWWRHELYRIDPEVGGTDAKIWAVYWDGKPSPEEHAWQREITARWGFEVAPQQWTWRRWYLAERAGSDQVVMHQEFPTLPEHAFQASGQSFVGATVMARLRMGLPDAPPALHYKYLFGSTIEQTELVPTNEGLGDLVVWEEPTTERAAYVVAADPSYGANASSDRCVCQVWRATRSKLIQVAEFCSPEPSMSQFAWVCCHLAGVYQTSFFVLEINGPGIGVLQEIQRMQSYGWGTTQRARLASVLNGVQQYLYRRADSMRAGYAWQWRTSPHTKVPMMNRLRSVLMNDMLTVRSAAFVDECAAVRQSGNEFGATGRAHDDRVLTAAIAVEAWSEQVVPTLQMTAAELEPTAATGPQTLHERMLQSFFRSRLRGQ